MIGLTVSTAADAYFALRYRDNTDVINFTPIERFTMESWTQEAFLRRSNVTLQIVSSLFIFAEFYFGLIGLQEGHGVLAAIFVAFSMLRLAQFFVRETPALNMMQSNFTAGTLAAVSIYETFQTQSPLLLLASMVLGLDAFLGTALFMERNH